jgi:hypothetical protein
MLTTSSQASDYLPLALQCRTKNQFNLLHIAFENILAPIEFTHFTDLVVSQELPQGTHDWLRKIYGLSPGLFDAPQGFRRQALAENVLLYREPDRDVSGKSLLIGFAGNARRLMMPISIFLQCLDSRVWDVVLLRKGADQATYFAGVEGVAGSLPALVQYVESAVPAKTYGRIVTYGTSGGGLAAILAAKLMDAARGVSVSGAPPQAPLDPWLEWQLALRRAYAARRPVLDYVYGADCEIDRNSALSLQHMFGGRLHPVAGIVDHYALKPMLKSGQFPAFLNELLA